jgi:hypothetical protein
LGGRKEFSYALWIQFPLTLMSERAAGDLKIVSSRRLQHGREK